MDDAISRQAAIDAVRATLLSWSYMPEWRDNKIIEAVEQLPPIQTEPHWIPVTKPPKDRRICYVTLKDTNDENRQNWVAEMIYTPWDGFNLMDGLEALAWMPKKYPEPYKGVTE